jgi:CHAT domain-containing protein/tetratricopeptide (TPR) repeat protein
MNQTINEEEAIKQYLLGRLSEEEQTPLEERLLTDDDFFERLKLAEDELIDELLGGGLGTDERERFNSHFMAAPERQQKLRFSMVLKKYVAVDSAARLNGTEGSTGGGMASSRIKTPSNGPKYEGAGRPNNGANAEVGEQVDTVGLEQHLIPSPWARMTSNPYLRMAASILIVIAGGLGIYRGLFYRSDLDKGLDHFKRLYPNQRPLQARLTSLPDYAPYVELRGGHGTGGDPIEERRVELLFSEALHEHPSARSEHALGVFYLASGRADQALLLLERATEGSPTEAQFHSDLAAAYLEVARSEGSGNASSGSFQSSGKRMEHLARCLEELNKGLGYKPALLEALFNRGLCHEEMALWAEAEDDWQGYLGRDANSKWAEEARQHLTNLQELRKRGSRGKDQVFQDYLRAYHDGEREMCWKILARTRDDVGSFVEERLVDAYLESATSDRTEEVVAADWLKAIGYIGEMELEKTGDRFTLDLIRFYGSLSSKRLRAIREARRLKALGDSLLSDSNDSEHAIVRYQEARKLYLQTGDQWGTRIAEYKIGWCYLRQLSRRTAEMAIQKSAQTAAKDGYLRLFGRCLLLLGDVYLSAKEYSKALDLSHRSVDLLGGVGDLNGVLTAQVQLAQENQWLGNNDRALGHAWSALAVLSENYADDMRRWMVYSCAAAALGVDRLYPAALDYQTEAARIAMDMRRPLIISRSYDYLGELQGRLHNYDGAAASLRVAYETGQRLAPGALGTNMMAHSALQLGNVYRFEGDFTSAISWYERSVSLYDTLNFPAYRYEAHKGKLLSLISLNDTESAIREIPPTLELLEKYRAEISEEDNRNSFFDAEQDAYDAVIDFEFSRLENVVSSFDHSEASRARSLFDILGLRAHSVDRGHGRDLEIGTRSSPLPLTEILAALADRVQILEYSVVENKIIGWLLDGVTARPFSTDIQRRALEDKVSSFIRALRDRSQTNDEELALSKDLYRILIKPIESGLDKGKIICIVPDKILSEVPFDALVSPSGRYLLQDFASQMCYSSSVFVTATRIASVKAKVTSENLLTVGNPQFDGSTFPGLQSIASAGAEAESIAALYDSRRVLTGAAAKPSAVAAAMTKANVIDLAVHYLPDTMTPLNSQLVLAPDVSNAGNSVLRVGDLYAMDLARPRVIILAGCETGFEGFYRGEGPINLARPFIAAGIPVVVASLWPVDSEQTRRLMVNFHRHRKVGGLSSLFALREAKLDMLTESNAPDKNLASWAAFVLIGGFASF